MSRRSRKANKDSDKKKEKKEKKERTFLWSESEFVFSICFTIGVLVFSF